MRGGVAAASGLEKVGETLMGFLLGGLGKAGQGIAGIARGLGQALIAALSAGGALVSAGVKLAGGLVGGLIGGLGAGAGAIAGALIGTFLIPGLGGVAGATLGVAIASFLGQTASTLLTTLGGALGDAVAGIGDAVGKMLGSVGSALSSIQKILADLIDTGTRWAASTLTVSRTGNLPLVAAGGVSALASILTGNPGGLSSVYVGLGDMSQYRGTKLRAFGVKGATGQDPLADIAASAETYRHMNLLMRQILVGGAYGGNEAIGNLFALNAQSPGIAGRAIQVARDTAPTPKETVQNATLALNIAEAESKMDRLKLKFLSDLMPAITKGLNLFSGWFTTHEKGILGSLESIGAWFYVKLPGYIATGVKAVFEMGKAFLLQLPAIATGGKALFALFAAVVNVLKPIAAVLLTMAAGMGLVSKEQARQEVDSLRKMPALDPYAMDKTLDGMVNHAAGWYRDTDKAKRGSLAFLNGHLGTEQTRAAQYHSLVNNAGTLANKPQQVDVHIHVEEHPEMLNKISTHVAGAMVRSIQRQGT